MSAEPAVKHVCIRRCYYLSRMWQEGEILEDRPGYDDAPPGKHFAPIGSDEALDPMETIKFHGDDPRSTAQLIDALGRYGEKVSDGTPRKEIFRRLLIHEEALDERTPEGDMGGTTWKGPEEGSQVHIGGAADPDLPQKAVSSLNPDELEETTQKQLLAMILRDRDYKAPYNKTKRYYFELDQKLAAGSTSDKEVATGIGA